MKLRVWIKKRCDEVGLCEYIEVPLARAARILDKVDLEDVYIIVDDVDPQLIEY
ncbi:MAG: hypothetical protein QXP98_04805 [Thermoproteus sp.]